MDPTVNRIEINYLQDYTVQFGINCMILERIEKYLSEILLFEKDLKGSKIIGCIVNDKNSNINKYHQLLIHLYSEVDLNTILQNSTLNISLDKISEKGFKYYDDIGLSIQSVEARKTLKEIINIVKVMNYSLELRIKLKNEEIIRFKI
jgi:hypothetical protein